MQSQLASVPQDIAHYGSRIAEYIEKHTSSIAADIRDAIDSASWIPDSMRPPSRQAHHFFAKTPPLPQGVYAKTVDWVSRNRNAIAIVVAFAGTTVFLIHRKRRAHARKRRARKLANGAKKEIVVLACSTYQDPLTRSLALDLERRGYVVYITIASSEEEGLVLSESKPDIRPLWVDMSSTVPNLSDIHPDLQPIRDLVLRNSESASASSKTVQQNLTLAGIVALPGTSSYPTQPLAQMSPSDLIDVVNTRLLAPVLTIQKFLPLLATTSPDPKSPSAIILAYPSISLSLSPPDSASEVITTASMSALAHVLRRELRATKLNVTLSEVRLGNFDLGSTPSRPLRENESEAHATALTHWHSAGRAAAQRSTYGQSTAGRGSSTREFHNAIFDALAPPQTFMAFGRFEWQATRRPSVVYVGSGARLYAVLGAWTPAGLVGWMMGYDRPSGKRMGSGFGEKTSFPAASVIWGTASVGNESQVWEKV